MDFQIVTATYKDHERLWWLPQVAASGVGWMLYHKNDELEHNQQAMIDEHNIAIANYGRSEYAFLHHIVHNYLTLADHTLFTKSSWFQDQHRGASIDINRAIADSTKYDYLDEGLAPILQIWNPNVLKNIAPVASYDFCVDKMYGQDIAPGNQMVLEWYHDMFDMQPPDCQYCWAHGPVFAVSRRLIHQKPLLIWRRLYDRFLPTSPIWHKGMTHPVKDRTTDQLRWDHNEMMLRFNRTLFTHGVAGNFKIRPDWTNLLWGTRFLS